jgi:hypothetical protein
VNKSGVMRKPELTEDDLELRTSKPLSDTSMGTPAIPKCLLGSTLTVHVKSVRFGENFLVSVG